MAFTEEEITDPELIKRLEAAPMVEEEVTDPDILARLESPDTQTAFEDVTDPDILARLDAPDTEYGFSARPTTDPDILARPAPDDRIQRMTAARSQPTTVVNEIDDASPIMRRVMSYRRDVEDFQRRSAEMKELTGTGYSPEREAFYEDRRQKLEKTLSLFDPKVNEQMLPTWKTLYSKAFQAGLFGSAPAQSILPGGADRKQASRKEYESLRNKVAEDFNLQPDELDSLVTHHMGLQKDDVSRDPIGTVHIKDSLMVKPVADIERAIQKSKLPESVKAKTLEGLGERVTEYKARVVKQVMENSPDLAKRMELSPDLSAEQNYQILTDNLNKDATEQAAVGAAQGIQSTAAFAAHAFGLFEEKFRGGKIPYGEKVAEEIRGRQKFNEDLANLSHQINQDRVELFNTDAAVLGRGVYSGVESLAGGYLLGGASAAERLLPAFRVNQMAGFSKALATATKNAIGTAPITGYYGLSQASDTYDTAMKSTDPSVRARAGELALKAGAFEFGIPLMFSAFGAGGNEAIGARLGSEEAREAARQAGKTVGKAWADAGLGTLKGTAGELPEELLITLLSDLAVNAETNPNLTVDDLKKNLKDTLAATLVASGPVAGGGSLVEQGGNLFKSSVRKDPTERAVSELLTPENESVAPETAAAVRDTAPAGLGIPSEEELVPATPGLPMSSGLDFTNAPLTAQAAGATAAPATDATTLPTQGTPTDSLPADQAPSPGGAVPTPAPSITGDPTLDDIAKGNDEDFEEDRATLQPSVPAGLTVVRGDPYGGYQAQVSMDGTELRVPPGFIKRLKQRFKDRWEIVKDLIVDEELFHHSDIQKRGGREKAESSWAQDWQDASAEVKRLFQAAYRGASSLDAAQKGAEISRMRDQAARLGRVTESESTDSARAKAADALASLLAPTVAPTTADNQAPSPGGVGEVVRDASKESQAKRGYIESLVEESIQASLDRMRASGRDTTNAEKAMDGIRNGDFRTKVKVAMDHLYSKLRVAGGQDYSSYIVSDSDAFQAGQSTPSTAVNNENKWFYRGPRNLMTPKGWAGKRGDTKFSANVTFSPQMIDAMDAFMDKLQRDGIDAYYKVPDEAAGWDSRHDPLSVYASAPLSPTLQQELVGILSPHVRTNAATVNNMTGAKVADGIFEDANPTKADVDAVLAEAEKIGGSDLRAALDAIIGKKASTAQMHAARAILSGSATTPSPAPTGQPTASLPAGQPAPGGVGEVVRDASIPAQMTPEEYLASYRQERPNDTRTDEQIKRLHFVQMLGAINGVRTPQSRDGKTPAVYRREPISAEALDAYGQNPPADYVRQGDLYVYAGDGAAPTPATQPAKQPPSRIKKAIAKAKKELGDALNVTKDPAVRIVALEDGTVHVNIEALEAEAAANGMDDAAASRWIAAAIDEEVRHAAQHRAARAQWQALGGYGVYEEWRNKHYGAIWRNEFVDGGKSEMVQALYGNKLNKLDDWQKAFEGLRIIQQKMATGSPTEVAALWASLKAETIAHIRAALKALKQMLKGELSPTLKAEIAAIEKQLIAYDRANKPRAGNPKDSVKKPGSQTVPQTPLPMRGVPVTPEAQPREAGGRPDSARAETTAPVGLDRDTLKSVFNLTDEQADAAQSMSRALGLTPEQVLLEREFTKEMGRKPKKVKAEPERLRATQMSDALAPTDQKGRRITAPMRDEAGNYVTPDGVEVTLTDESSVAELNGEQYSGDIEIDFIGVPNAKDRGKKSASKELDRILAEADKRDMSVSLTVDPESASDKGAPKGLSAAQLIDWYSRKGFIFDGRNGYRPRKSEDRSVIEPKTTTMSPAQIEEANTSINEGTDREFSDPDTMFAIFAQTPSEIPKGYVTASDDKVYYYDGVNRPVPVSNVSAIYDYENQRYVVEPVEEIPTSIPDTQTPKTDARPEETAKVGDDVNYDGETLKVLGYEEDGRIAVQTAKGAWKHLPKGSKVTVLPPVENPYAGMVSDVESGFGFMSRLKIKDAPSTAEAIPKGDLPRGTRYFRSDTKGTGAAIAPFFAITPDGLLYEDSGRSMTHGGLSPYRLLGKIGKKTLPDNLTQPTLFDTPRQRSLSSMRAEVVRKLADPDLDPVKEDRLVALLGRIESSMVPPTGGATIQPVATTVETPEADQGLTSKPPVGKPTVAELARMSSQQVKDAGVEDRSVESGWFSFGGWESRDTGYMSDQMEAWYKEHPEFHPPKKEIKRGSGIDSRGRPTGGESADKARATRSKKVRDENEKFFVSSVYPSIKSDLSPKDAGDIARSMSEENGSRIYQDFGWEKTDFGWLHPDVTARRYAVAKAITDRQPVTSEIKADSLPTGYVRDGDLYVYRPQTQTATPTPESEPAAPPVGVAPTPLSPSAVATMIQARGAGRMSGPQFAEVRAQIMSEIAGKPVPKSKAGFNAFRKAVGDALGINNAELTAAGYDSQIRQRLYDMQTRIEAAKPLPEGLFSGTNPPPFKVVATAIEGLDDDQRVARVKQMVAEMEVNDPNIGRSWNSNRGVKTIKGLLNEGGTLTATNPSYLVENADGAQWVQHAKDIEETIRQDEYRLTPEYAKEQADAAELQRLRAERDAREKAQEDAIEARVDAYLDTLGKTPMQRGKLKSTLTENGSKRVGGKEYRGNRFDVVSETVADGYRPLTKEVTYNKDVSRLTMRQRMDRANLTGTKTEYYLERGDSRFPVTKAEYDLANWSVEQTATEQAPTETGTPPPSPSIKELLTAPGAKYPEALTSQGIYPGSPEADTALKAMLEGDLSGKKPSEKARPHGISLGIIRPQPISKKVKPEDMTTDAGVISALKNVASSDTTRYIINSVLFDKANQVLVASDGRMLITVPAKVGRQRIIAKRIIATSDSAVAKRVSKYAKGVEVPKDIKAGAEIDGNYPNWKQVVPDYSKEKDVVTQKWDINDLATKSRGAARAHDFANLGSYKSATFRQGSKTVSLNPYLLTDLLEAMQKAGASTVDIAVLDGESPVLFKTDNGITGVLMPIRDNTSNANDVILTETGTQPTTEATERFQSPTTTPQSDADYLAAVERGDMETAQRMVDEAAKKSGYIHRVYHGTKVRKLTKFALDLLGSNTRTIGSKIGFFVSSRFDISNSDQYVGRYYEGNWPSGKSKQTGEVLSLFVKSDKPFLVTPKKDQLESLLVGELLPVFGGKYPTGEQVRNYLIKNGYDSVKWAGRQIGDRESSESILLHPEQLKSADPVTYDADGNVIPLSQRFNQGNNDIRYQSPTDFKQQVKQYEDAEWDTLTTGEQFTELKNFAEKWITSSGGIPLSENPQGMGRKAFRFGSEPRQVVLQLGERGGQGLSDVRELVRTGRHAGNRAGIDAEGNVTITIGSRTLAVAVDSGTDQMVAKENLARIIQEEIVHAAHLIAVKEQIQESGKPVTGSWTQTVEQEIERTFDQMVSEASPEALERALAASTQLYAGERDLNAGMSAEEILDRMGGMERFVAMGELVRQTIQLRRSGGISETTRPSWLDKVAAWMQKAVDVLKEFASRPSALGNRFAQEIERTEQILAELDGTRYQKRPQGAKGSAQLTADKKVLIKAFESADFTTITHEMMHGFEMTGYGDLTEAEVATLKTWAGSKTKGREMMETKASEKLARGWEKYIATGKAPLQSLQELFDKMSKWMLDVYKQITGSDIDVDISPEVTAIFDKIALRMGDSTTGEVQNPAVVYAPTGATIETSDGTPLPPAIPFNPEEITDDLSPEEATEKLVGMLRGVMENPPAPPAPPAPEPSEDWNPENLDSLQKRRREEYAAQYGLNMDDWKQSARSFPEVWQEAVSAMESSDNQAGAEIIARIKRDPATVLTDTEIAILNIESLRRKNNVDLAIKGMQTPEALASKEEMESREAIYNAAFASFQEIQNMAARGGTASGRSLQAWKMAARDDFSVATLQSRDLTRYNAVRVRAGKPPVTELPMSEVRKILAFSEKMLAMQARMRDMEGMTDDQRAAYEARIKEQDDMIAALIEERKSAFKKTAVTDLTKRLLVNRIQKAAADAEARLRAAGLIDPTLRYQSPTPQNDPRWYDRVLVLAAPVVINPAMTAAAFTDYVLKKFGQGYAAVADALRKDVDKHVKSTLSDISGGTHPTPDEVMEGAPDEVTRELVYEVARAHVYDGARNTEVMDRTHATLADTYSDLTREQVSQLFTDYGRQTRLTPGEEAKALRDARSLELVQKQIDDLEARGQMKKTGRAKDDPSPELRELRKKRDDLAKEIGYVPVDPATGLSSAQTAARKRMENEIEELQNAIDSGVARVRVRRGVKYTVEMEELRTKLEGLRKDYENTFGQERTPEERSALILKSLDRQIAREQKLINDGLLKSDSTLPPLVDTPEILERREYLKQLREEKFAMWDAAHPGERALAQAMKEAEAAVARRNDIVANGLRETPARRQRGEGVNPTEALTALWEAADAMDVLIREMRRNRPLTPAQEQKRLDAAYDAAIQTRDALLDKIARGDLSVAPKSQAQVEARTRALRLESAALRKQLTQMQKDAGIGPFSQEAKESRKVAILQRKLAELRRRRVEKDYADKARPEPVTSEEIRQLDADIELAKMDFESERAGWVYDQLGKPAKYKAKFMAVYQARMMFNLTGDFGVWDRQLGKVNFLLVANDLKNIGKAIARGEKPDISATSVGKMIGRAFEAFMSREKQVEIYRYYATHPMYPFMKAAGFQLANPHETSFELSGDGEVRINPMTVINDVALATLMLAKGIVKASVGVMTGGLVPGLIGAGVRDTLLSVGLAVGGRRYALRVERAQQTMLNVARWETAMLALNMYGSVDPKVNPRYAQDVMSAVMSMTGRIGGTGEIAKKARANAYILSHIVSYAAYRVSNFETISLNPLRRMLFKKNTARATGVVSTMYGMWLAGTATRMTVAAMIFGMLFDDEGDDEGNAIGLVTNWRNPRFGQIKIGPKTYIDFASGARVWMTDLIGMFGNETLDREMLAEGVEIAKLHTARDKSQARLRFFDKVTNPNLATLRQFLMDREFREGGPLERQSALSQLDRINDEILMNLTAKEFNTIMEEHGPVEGAKIFALLMMGNNVTIREDTAARIKRESEEAKRLTKPPRTLQ